jgi:hypothetical protein
MIRWYTRDKMIRRMLAVLTAFFLVTGALWVPRGVEMVCRISGTVLTPEVIRKMPCCQTEVRGDTVVLRRPGCCELRQGHQQMLPTGTLTAITEIPVAHEAPGIPIAVPVCIVFALHNAPTLPPYTPRPPPIGSLSPRAPPLA